MPCTGNLPPCPRYALEVRVKPKKILLLGGSFFQIPSIEAVKRMGHYAITCDYRPDNPGHRLADEYHNVRATDREGVLRLTRWLRIDVIVCCLFPPCYTSPTPLL